MKESVTPLKILLALNSSNEFSIIENSLNETGIPVELNQAQGMDGMKKLLGVNAFDCIISDYDLEGGSGLEMLGYLKLTNNQTPFIIIAKEGEEKIGPEAIKQGAVDYILFKDFNTDFLILNLSKILLKKMLSRKNRSK